MNLNNFLGPIDLQGEDRWGAINELVSHLVANHKIKPEHRNAVVESVKKRELSMSTGIGSGIGLPHASTDLVEELVGAIGRSRKGVQFDALDGKLVNVVALFLVPKGQFQKHLHALSDLAKLLGNNNFRNGL